MASAPAAGGLRPAEARPASDLSLTKANLWSKYAGNLAVCQDRLTIGDTRSAALDRCGDGDGGICNDKEIGRVSSRGVF